MKKLFLVSFFITPLLHSYAQPGKGRYTIGGSFNFSQNSNRSKDTNTIALTQKNTGSNFTGSLRYGYFVTDNLLIGLLGSYSQNSSSSENPYLYSGTLYTNKSSQASNSASLGLFSRYYKMFGKSKFAFFGHLSFTYGINNSINKTNQSINIGDVSHETKSTSYNAFFAPGICYFISKNCSLESTFGNLGFTAQRFSNYERGNKISSSESSGFNSNLNLGLSNIFIGFNFYFGGGSLKKSATN